MKDQPGFRLVVRVVPQAGEVAATDLLGQLLAEIRSLEAFDPGGDGDVRFILDDITMNSPVSATLHPAGPNQDEAEHRAVIACRSVLRAVDSSRRTGRIPLGTTQKQRVALRSLVNHKRRNFQEFSTELDIKVGDKVENLIITASSKAAVRDALDSELESSLFAPSPKHKEYGSVDGRLVAVGQYHTRSAFDLESSVYGLVRCVVPEELIAELGGEVRLSDVWKNVRVFVGGSLMFREDGTLDRIVVDNVEAVPLASDINLITDKEFTSGIPAEEYLRKLREGLSA